MSKSVIDKLVIAVITILIPLIVALILIKRLDKMSYDYLLFDGVDIVNKLLGVWSTLLGFMITAVSILMTVGGNTFIDVFRKSKHYHTVMYTNALTCLILFLTTTYSVGIICMNIWNKLCFCKRLNFSR